MRASGVACIGADANAQLDSMNAEAHDEACRRIFWKSCDGERVFSDTVWNLGVGVKEEYFDEEYWRKGTDHELNNLKLQTKKKQAITAR